MSFLIGLVIGFVFGALSITKELNQSLRALYKAIGCEVKYKAKNPRVNNT